jgi:hypothetical protein
MTDLQIWIIESAHVNPDNFFVELDGSPSYKAYWVAQTHSAQEAEKLTRDIAGELELGEVKIVQTVLYAANSIIESEDVTARIEDIVSNFQHYEDAQMAAWISSEGGLL